MGVHYGFDQAGFISPVRREASRCPRPALRWRKATLAQPTELFHAPIVSVEDRGGEGEAGPSLAELESV